MKKTLALLLVCTMLLLGCQATSLADSLFPLEEAVTLSFGIRQNNNVSDYYDNTYTKWLEEQTGVKLEFSLFPSAVADAQTKVNLMVASGDVLPDILAVGLTTDTVYEWGSMGLLLPLNDYYAASENYQAWCETLGLDGDGLLKQIVSLDGNVYAAPYYGASYNDQTGPSRTYINRNWLETLGLSAPTTWDELVTVLTAFRDQDPNGNGEADEIPLFGSSGMLFLQNMFIYAGQYGWYLPLSEAGGAVDVCYDKDAYRAAMIAINDLVAEGLYSALSFTMDSTQITALYQAETTQVGMISSWGADAFGSGKSADDYIAFEVPAGPEGVRYITINPTAASPLVAVTSYCEHPEVAMEFINIMFDERFIDQPMISRYGEKDVDWRYYDPELDKDLVGAIPGMAPYVVQLNTQWGVMSNKLWQQHVLASVFDPGWWVASVNPEKDYNLPAYLYGQNYALNRQYGPENDDLLMAYSFAYTPEEVEQWTDMRVALKTYIDETRVQFALGQLNPADDAVWASYLEQLNKLQYKELLEVDNAAYQRKLG